MPRRTTRAFKFFVESTKEALSAIARLVVVQVPSTSAVRAARESAFRLLTPFPSLETKRVELLLKTEDFELLILFLIDLKDQCAKKRTKSEPPKKSGDITTTCHHVEPTIRTAPEAEDF